MSTEFEIIHEGGLEELITISEKLAENGVNISTIALERGDQGKLYLRFYPDDIDLTRESLRSLGVNFREKEVILVEVEDRLGQYATVARKLHQAKVEILASHLLTRKGNKMQLIFEVDKLEVARKILEEQIIGIECEK